MADKAISELEPVSTITLNDNFVLEQANVARRLTGQVLLNELATKLDGHGGINNITGPVSSGDYDTYTIHYADQSTTQYTIKNGRSITSIAKKSTDVLVDTYQINYSDGSPTTYTVTNGRSITSVAKKSTLGLVDTYQIDYSDGTKSTFTVTNGVSISSVTKKSTSGLVDTYQINYSNGTNSTFTVTNGEKGDNLTIQSVVMTYGSSTSTNTQPTTWKNSIAELGNVQGKYVWTKFVTTYNAGDPYTHYEIAYQGNNLAVSSVTVTYGKSNRTNNQPTTWYNTIAELGDVSGMFVWTKYVTTYNDNNTYTSYSTAYQGINGTGTGTVTAVNTVAPDATGNVTITAANVNYTPFGSSTPTTVANTLDNKVITLSSPINIPGPGVSSTYTVNGITANHRVLLWNFSASAENNPPTDIRITTSASSISVTNLGDQTISETIQPIFAVPIAKSVS